MVSGKAAFPMARQGATVKHPEDRNTIPHRAISVAFRILPPFFRKCTHAIDTAQAAKIISDVLLFVNQILAAQ
jgi:hypothetical protein